MVHQNRELGNGTNLGKTYKTILIKLFGYYKKNMSESIDLNIRVFVWRIHRITIYIV